MRQGGFRVYSTYEPALQRAAEQAIRLVSPRSRRAVAARRISRAAWSRSIRRTGDVLALVGGRNFSESPYNRATQARRQPGSAFKPIIYAAALERGYAPGSMLRDLDTPIGGYGAEWLPGGEHENSEYTLRSALQVSSNRAAAQVLQHVGIGAAVDYAHRLGINSRAAVGAFSGPGHRRSHAARTDSGLRRLRQRRHAGGAALHLAHRGCEWAHGLVVARRFAPRCQFDDSVPHVEHARGCRLGRDGQQRPRRRVHSPRRRQDRHHRQLRRRLVHRLYAAPRRWSLVRPRHACADHESRLCRGGGGAGVGAFHEGGNDQRQAGLVRGASRCREGGHLPVERRARHRRLPSRAPD